MCTVLVLTINWFMYIGNDSLFWSDMCEFIRYNMWQKVDKKLGIFTA